MDGTQVVIIVIIVLGLCGIVYESGIIDLGDIGTSEVVSTDTDNASANDNNNGSSGDSGNTSNTPSSGSTSSSSSSTGSTESSSYSGDPTLTKVTFYSDGNTDTGETATLYLGQENAGKEVQVATQYYRDDVALNSRNYISLTISDDGTVKITDNTPMSKYPDYCEISVLYNGNECGGAVNLEKHSGSQTVDVYQ